MNATNGIELFPISAQTSDSLALLVEEVAGRLEAGESINPEQFIQSHQEHDAALRQILPAIVALAEFGNSDEAVAAADPLAGALDERGRLGDFRIIRELGRGGMGIVYEAEQISLARRVALKILPFASMLDPRHLQRFKNEALAAAHLDHPNIVEVYGVGCERGVHFYAMRFVEGQTLAEVIDAMRNHEGENSPPSAPGSAGGSTNDEAPEADSFRPSSGACPPRRVLRTSAMDTSPIAALSTLRTTKPRDFFRTVAELGIQAAEALDHAHQMGVVHRDIKPSNLMIEVVQRPRSKDQGQSRKTLDLGLWTLDLKLWITDFGLARVESDVTLTMTGDLLGTLRYMSPEQAEGRSAILDHRTDIYSLGVTLYELLTLWPVFPGNDRATLLRQIAFDEPTPPRKVTASVPPELETIVLKSIAKDAADRYSSAGALADDLRRFVRHEPIRARLPSFTARAGKWARRHPWAIVGALSALVGLLVVMSAAFLIVADEKEQTATALHKAEVNLRVARDAVDALYIDFAASWLTNTAQPSAVQEDFLHRAAGFYEALAQETEQEPAQLRETATAYARLGEIRHYLHQNSQAARALSKSVSLGQQLTYSGEFSDEDRAELARRYRQLHEVFLHLGQTQEAADALTEGWHYAQSLPSDVGNGLKDTAEAAAWYVYRADHSLRQDNPQQAEQHARKGKQMAARLLREQPNDAELELLFLKNRRVLSEALQAQGRLADAYTECEQALRSCRGVRMSDQRDSRPYHELQISLLDQLAAVESAQGTDQKAADHLRESLTLRRKTFEDGKSPSVIMANMFKTVLGGSGNWKGHYDPDAFCGYAETQIKLAKLFMKVGRPYEAECQLGEAIFTLGLVANSPRIGLRYEIALANAYAVSAQHCQHWLPREGPLLLDAAVSIWQVLLEESDAAANYSSGLHGRQNDLAWFRVTFGDPEKLPPTIKRKKGWLGTLEHPHFELRAAELSLFSEGYYADALKAFQSFADEREAHKAFDWLYVAMSHAHLGQREQAQNWYDKSAQEIAASEEQPVELIELRDATKRLLDEKRSFITQAAEKTER